MNASVVPSFTAALRFEKLPNEKKERGKEGEKEKEKEGERERKEKGRKTEKEKERMCA